MERGEGLTMRAARGRALAVVLALAALVVGAPQALFAGHVAFNWSTVEAGGTCYSCHTLDYAQGAGALGTSMINPSARGGIFNLIKTANGGTTPTDLGCIFCHNNPSNVKMKGILNHFLNPWSSRHPVGYNWNTGVNTDHEYVSSNDASSRTTSELDCMDCHDATSIATGGSYVNHPGTIQANNPNMLKLVSVNNEYDAFCRSCHRSDIAVNVAGKGTKTIQLASHADAATGREIKEADGTVLKTTAAGGNAQCTKCHDTHYSSKVKMFNDGHEGDTPIVGDNCLAVCHYPGDNINFGDDTTNNSYERHGHGKQTSTYKYRAGKVDFTAGSFKTVNMSCAACHNSLDTGTTDGTRVIHVDKNPTGGTNTEKYVKRYNIGLTMQDEGGGSDGGNPILGVCENCHAAYESHLAEGGNVTSGCQDCHDEHAENSGTTSNVFMIPLSGKPSGTYSTPTRPRAGSERIEYTQTAIDPATGNTRASGDQYRADGMGQCDNTECHGTVSNASQPGPLSTFFSGGYHGTGGSQSAGTVCEVCHLHQSDTTPGSWTPDPAGCGACHDYPGITHATDAHVLSGVHTKHTDLSTGKGFDCSVCHQNAQHNDGATPGGTLANGTEWAAKVDPNLNARVQVRFDTTWNPGVGSNPAATSSDNTNYNDTTNVCSNTFCHALKGTAGDPGAQGSTPTPAWSGTLACGACHGDTTAALTSNSHGAHLQTTTSGGAQCANCHTAYDLAVAGTHMNGTVNFAGTFTYSGNAGDKLPSTGRGTCGTNSCHTNGQLAAPRTTAYTWGAALNGTNSCTECHGDTSATLTTQAHDRHLGAGYVVCSDCHAAHTVTTHGDGTITLGVTYTGGDVVAAVNGGTFGTCTTGSCHNATSNIAWNGTPTSCNSCHQAAAGAEDNWNGRDKVAAVVVTGEYTGFGHGKSASPVIDKACTDCHEISTTLAPHSFTTNLAGTNPYRLKAGFTCSDAAAGCHNSGNTGTLSGVDISLITTHSSAAMGGGKYSWPWTPQCVNCHDPHGDASNIAMMQNELFDKAAFNLFAPPPTSTPYDNSALAFTDFTTGASAGGTSWARTGSVFSSLCQECHENTAMFAFEDNTSAGVSPHTTASPVACYSCHKHDSGFKASGCDGCHGNGAGQMWPQNAGSSLSGYPDRNGRHLAHLDDIAVRRYSLANAAAMSEAQQSEACGMCHNDPNGVGGSNHSTLAAPADVGNFAQFWGAYATTDVAPARSYNPAGYTSSTWNAGTATCIGVDCHNNQTTPTTWEWYGAATTSCLMCHTVGTTASAFANPISGHHDSAVTTGLRHDNSFQYGVNGATLGTCSTCHISGTSGPTTSSGHINGAVDTSIGAIDAGNPLVYLAPTVGFTDAVTPTCTPNGALGQCHLEQWRTSPASTWVRIWHEQGTNTDGQQCKGCHGTWATGWRTGVSPVHTSDWDGTTANEIYDNHDNGATPDNYNQCRICHTYNETAYFMGGETNNLGWARKVPASSTYHGDGNITMNGTFAYSTSAFNCGTNCHTTGQGNTAHNLADSGWPANFVNGPGLACTGCHSGITTHLKLTKGGADAACQACHPGGAGLPVQHSKNNSAYVTLIPNATIGAVGINYTGNGETGIYLGGYAMSAYGAATTEAEMCWRCHDSDNNGTLVSANDISEWGTNTDTNTATYPNYNFGTLSARNWIGATWSSGTTTPVSFAYKSGTIQSTHSANVSGISPPTAPGLDTVAQLRCSYCHDVHEMAKATNDTATGKPYLRGTWAGNPYKEDGAPQSGTVYSNFASWGSVPRGASSAGMNMGGYWIDQNSASPTNNAAFSTFGGLCDLCHGTTKNGILDDVAGDIDDLNVWGNNDGGTQTEWTSGWNGHANSVKGGSGPSDAAAARNIYNARGGTSVKANQAPYAHYAVLTSCPDAGYGFRGPSGIGYTPMTADQACKFAPTRDEWGVDERGTATQTSYHNFPCSKCHNPHASRLPRLMITNCLDTKHNTWDDSYQVVAVGSLSRGRRLSNWQSAQNCHRNVGDGTADAGDSTGYSVTVNGWNKVTPW